MTPAATELKRLKTLKIFFKTSNMAGYRKWNLFLQKNKERIENCRSLSNHYAQLYTDRIDFFLLQGVRKEGKPCKINDQ